jgi:hypothetical protein
MAALTPMVGSAAAESAGIAADVEIVAAAALKGVAAGAEASAVALAAAVSWARAPFSASRMSRLARRAA